MAESRQRTVGIVGLFDEPDSLIEAAEAVRDTGHEHWDCHTPYPVHGIEAAMGLPDTKLGNVAITAGFIGLLTAFILTGGLSVIYYPIQIGGKALMSWQAFVPIYFELFVMFAGLTALASVILMGKLCRWHSPLHDSGVMQDITCDRFAIVVESDDFKQLEATYRPLFEKAGCTDIRPLMENVEPGGAL